MRIAARIDAERARYRKANGRDPERVILNQDQYLRLSAEIGRIIHEYNGLPIVIRWGATNKAISP